MVIIPARLELHPEANGYLITCPAIRAQDGGTSLELSVFSGRLTCGLRPVAARELNTGDERRLGTDHAAELIGDRGEHLGQPRASGYQRGHPPQRGLLIGKLTQPRLARWITVRPRVSGTAHAGAGVWRVHKADASPALGGPALLLAGLGASRDDATTPTRDRAPAHVP